MPMQDSIIFSPYFPLVSGPSRGCYMNRVHEWFLCVEGNEGKIVYYTFKIKGELALVSFFSGIKNIAFIRKFCLLYYNMPYFGSRLFGMNMGMMFIQMVGMWRLDYVTHAGPTFSITFFSPCFYQNKKLLMIFTFVSSRTLGMRKPYTVFLARKAWSEDQNLGKTEVNGVESK